MTEGESCLWFIGFVLLLMLALGVVGMILYYAMLWVAGVPFPDFG